MIFKSDEKTKKCSQTLKLLSFDSIHGFFFVEPKNTIDAAIQMFNQFILKLKNESEEFMTVKIPENCCPSGLNS